MYMAELYRWSDPDNGDDGWGVWDYSSHLGDGWGDEMAWCNVPDLSECSKGQWEYKAEATGEWHPDPTAYVIPSELDPIILMEHHFYEYNGEWVFDGTTFNGKPVYSRIAYGTTNYLHCGAYGDDDDNDCDWWICYDENDDGPYGDGCDLYVWCKK